LGGFGGCGGFGGAGDGYGDGAVAASLIANRDGIVGPWVQPEQAPKAMAQDDPENLCHWAAPVRMSLYEFEMVSRLNFSFKDDTATAWHLDTDLATTPECKYQPLVSMVRPDENNFLEQLPYLDTYADLRPDRMGEIITQSGLPIAFWRSIPFIDPNRTKWTFDLLNLALRLANAVEMQFKNTLACRRPNEFSAQVQPIIPTPLHGTLPSGHATEAFTVAMVLSRLLEQAGARQPAGHQSYATSVWPLQMLRMASRIAVNRTVAGVHFPVDSAAGAALGLTLGEYLAERCSATADTDIKSVTFKGTAFSGDFFWTDFVHVPNNPQPVSPPIKRIFDKPYLGEDTTTLKKSGQSKILTWLWQQALDEWT